ncbi:MAG: amino acid ABC transporter substrate-binding protein [Anaerolineaceae bacterium]|nr:amino acid ABC transporter substrate-binding protein [Anaerolineaceae bacterium]
MARVRAFTLLLTLWLPAAVVLAQDGVVRGPVMQAVLDRGHLNCGVPFEYPGFGIIDDAGVFEGVDVDICRAIAVAIFGDADAITFRPLRGVERQAAIQGGEVDVISRLTTRTLSRDTTWGVIYGPTTYFDGQGIGTRAEYGISTIDELDGAAICVQHGTTTELNITDATSARGLDIAILGYPDLTSTFHAYLEGRCEAWTANRASIIGLHTTSSDPAAHVILDILLSKEPGTPLSPQSDPQFAEVIAWTIFGLFSAEEHGITGANVDDFLGSDDPAIQRLLGQGGNASGSYLGLANDFMVEVIRQVGNYGEIFARNLSVPPFNLERGINALWTDGGLMYAPPFR